MIGFRGLLVAIVAQVKQFALVNGCIHTRPIDCIVGARFHAVHAWWAACRQCSIFVLRDFGMTILLFINTRPLSVLNRCRTSQKSWISGSVRERL